MNVFRTRAEAVAFANARGWATYTETRDDADGGVWVALTHWGQRAEDVPVPEDVEKAYAHLVAAYDAMRAQEAQK